MKRQVGACRLTCGIWWGGAIARDILAHQRISAGTANNEGLGPAADPLAFPYRLPASHLTNAGLDAHAVRFAAPCGRTEGRRKPT